MGGVFVGEVTVQSLSFLTPGHFPDDDPQAGLEDTLRLFELGERGLATSYSATGRPTP